MTRTRRLLAFLPPPKAGQAVEVEYLGLPGDPVMRAGLR